MSLLNSLHPLLIVVRWLHEPQTMTYPELGVPTPCGAVSTRGITVLVPGLLELQLYRNIFNAEMRPYPPRVRRDLGVGPRGNSRRPLTP